MRTDKQGCSSCPTGQEQFETYTGKTTGEEYVQYDYRHTDGHLFSTIARTLDAARARRDRWLRQKGETI